MRRNYSGLFFFVIGLVIVVGIFAGFGSMTLNEEGAVNAAETMGFTNVELTDSGILFPSFHGCDDKDFTWYDVRAVNSQGKEVDLKVCKGLFKGFTVRVK